MLNVAIDSGPLAGGDSVRGIGVYTRELLKALKMDGVDVSTADLSKYDIVHFTRFNPFRVSVPSKKPINTKFILTIYDLIPLVYPMHYPPGIKGWLKWQTNKLLIKKNIDAIITISETSKKDICRFLEIDPEKVFVTYLAAPSVFDKLEIGNWKLEIAKQFGLPKRFALYAGDINYNKNIPNLIKACMLAKIPLVIAGKQASEVEKMDMSHAEHKHLKNIDWTNVVRLGFVEDEDLVKLYNLASVYVQASFYEGFSLPPLQAVACETPVAISKIQCHVEVFGDDFDYFNPDDVEDIARKILSPNKDKNLPRDYSWDKTAKETLKIYESI